MPLTLVQRGLMNNILRVDGLSVSFDVEGGKLYALRGVDLTLGEGETLALVGESGSGKSVTGKAILGILPKNARVTHGRIYYKEKELISGGERVMSTLRGREMAMVPQDPNLSLDPIMRIGDTITEGTSVPKGLFGREAEKYKRKRAIELLGEVGIPDPVSHFREYPHRLSGGMRQRVAIAAALASSPRLLICDEPTTALDVTIEAQILDLLSRVKRDHGLSMIFITHDLGVVARIADKVAVMYAGEIVESGSVEDIFYDPKHPYTWALLSSLATEGQERLYRIQGQVPDMREPPIADAFAPRSEYAMEIDYMMAPPTFEVSEGHFVKSWLYHRLAPRVEMPRELLARIRRMKNE